MQKADRHLNLITQTIFIDSSQNTTLLLIKINDILYINIVLNYTSAHLSKKDNNFIVYHNNI